MAYVTLVAYTAGDTPLSQAEVAHRQPRHRSRHHPPFHPHRHPLRPAYFLFYSSHKFPLAETSPPSQQPLAITIPACSKRHAAVISGFAIPTAR